MIIKQNLVSPSKYNLKCPHEMIPEGICVHNTANDAPASGEISYMITNTNQTSFHLAVDDIDVWQGLPLDRNGWHAGDGTYGAGNRKHIGIEICYSKSGGVRFTKAEDNAVELIAQLLKERNWGIERVHKHQDFSGKYCPHRTLDLGWDRFIIKISEKLGGSMNELHKYLGVTNDTEAKAKLKEHLGENNGFCDWGNETRDGGHLGSARRRIKQLELEIDQLNADIRELKGQIQSHVCPVIPPTEPETKWMENGKSVTTIEGNVTTTINYAVKQP